MSYIIDRRLNSKKKSTVNRQRFLRRYKQHIKKSVDKAVNKRSITDLDRGGQVSIPAGDISEPIFHHGEGGYRKRVLPGNKEFVVGDQIKRPPKDGSGKGGSASDQGEGEDEFSFQITQDEFLEFMFSDLELPNLVKKQLQDATSFEYRRAGFTNVGSPDKLNVVRSLKAANARRIALSGKERRRIREINKMLDTWADLPEDARDKNVLADLLAELEVLKKRVKRFPYIDEFDLKYNNLIKIPLPSSKAVMFCLMDVSGSMTQDVKDIAKRFFILLYLFLTRNYKQIDVVFVRHHTSAKEVDEEEFFYSRETGGTVVSSALKLCDKIIRQRYARTDWNIYVAQASDGDNWDRDSMVSRDVLGKRIMPVVQYFNYVEITQGPPQNLWLEYEKLRELYPDHFAMEKIESVADIYPVFRQLFEKKQ